MFKKHWILFIIFLAMEKETKKTKLFNVKMITATAILLAVEIVLQIIGNVLPGAVTINLSLITITLGALLYGPLVGSFLGFASGVIVLLSPNTISVFLSISPVATVFACLTKTTIAGVGAGFLYRLISKKNEVVASVIASIVVPVLNTFIFTLFCQFCFLDGLKELGIPLTNYWSIFAVLIGINFTFEIISNAIICPISHKVIKQSVIKK